jgi:hypothetical protein
MSNRNSEFGDIMPISGNLSHEDRMAALGAFGDGAKLMSNPDGSSYLQLTDEQRGAPWQGGYMPNSVDPEAGARSNEDDNSQAASPDTLSEKAADRRAFLRSRPGFLAVIWQVLRTSLIRPRLNCRLTISIANS